MRYKGSVKGVRKTNFWGKFYDLVPEEKRDMVYEQYYSVDKLFIYCDMSKSKEKGISSIACSFVNHASVYIKNKYLYQKEGLFHKNQYGEIKSLEFALKLAKDFINPDIKEVVIYSDMDIITKLLTDNYEFKDDDLKSLTIKIKKDIKKVSDKLGVNVNIFYLNRELQAHNPFYKSAHNAARKLINAY